MNISFLIVSCFFVMFLYCCTLYVYMFFVCCILCVINDDKSFVSNGACTKSRYRKLHIFLWGGGAIPSSGTYPTWRAFLALRDNLHGYAPAWRCLGEGAVCSTIDWMKIIIGHMSDAARSSWQRYIHCTDGTRTSDETRSQAVARIADHTASQKTI